VSRGGVEISAAVEGIVDRAVVERIAREWGLSIYNFHGLRGKQFLRQRIAAFNNAARFNPWLVLVDLDRCDCAPALLLEWLGAPSQFMRLRVAVRAIEAWLMADAASLSDFLHVRPSLVPGTPDVLGDPKQTLINLARRSTKAEIRRDMVAREGSGNIIGPAYASRLMEYFGPQERLETRHSR
jgi:hypothetical protein